MSVAKEIRKYVFQNYGNLISTREPQFDNATKTWIAELQSDYPRIIRDDRSPNDRILRFLSLGRLGVVRLGNDLNLVEATSRDDCVKNLSYFLRNWQERAERIVVTASSDRLAHIDEARWILAKVGMIISNLLQKEIILENEVTRRPPREQNKLRKYLKLLEGLDIVNRTKEGYVSGNMFVELLHQTNGIIPNFKIAVLSHVIRERYSVLKELFGISQLETFVHVDSCYYRPALEAEKLLYWTADSIIGSYRETYGRTSPLRLTYILGELVEAEALEREDDYYFGNERLFSQMLNLKAKYEELSFPRA